MLMAVHCGHCFARHFQDCGVLRPLLSLVSILLHGAQDGAEMAALCSLAGASPNLYVKVVQPRQTLWSQSVGSLCSLSFSSTHTLLFSWSSYCQRCCPFADRYCGHSLLAISLLFFSLTSTLFSSPSLNLAITNDAVHLLTVFSSAGWPTRPSLGS